MNDDAPRPDWVAFARAGIVFDIGQLDDAARADLRAAVRRGELVTATAPFAGAFLSKRCFAASHDAIEARVAADRAAVTLSIALDRAAPVPA